jgi:hypothetical protein
MLQVQAPPNRLMGDVGLGFVRRVDNRKLHRQAPRKLTHFDSDRIFAFDVSPDNQLVIAHGTFAIDMVLIKNVK